MAILPEYQSTRSFKAQGDELALSLSQLASRLVARALPVSSGDELLSAMIETWLSVLSRSARLGNSRVPSVFISFVVRGELIGTLITETDAQPIRIPIEHWSASSATDAVLKIVDSPQSVSSMTVVPFERDHKPLGGVLAFSRDDLENVGELAEISAALISQLNDALELSSNVVVRPERDFEADQRLRDLKLEAMAEFAAGAGHEINNPLGTITGRAALLLKSESDPERRRMLETIGGQAHRIRDMIGDAMTFARPPEPIKETCDVAKIAREVAAQLTRSMQVGVAVAIETERDVVSLDIDPEQFRVVLASLLRNSGEAIEVTGRIVVRVAADATDSFVRISVEDSGRGLTDAEREHLFDPFFSGRQAGRGLGFGLSKCWQILRMHGGSIEVDAEYTGGVRIVTRWPM